MKGSVASLSFLSLFGVRGYRIRIRYNGLEK